MDFQVESVCDILNEVTPLLIEHWEQIALEKDTIPLAPVWDGYRDLEAADALRIITAREDGELVGYAIYIIGPSLHYADQRFADADVFWLAPEHRKGMAGMRLFRHAEKVLKEAGVTRVFNKVKLHFDVGKVFERMGYKAVERVYAKGLV